MKYFILAFIVLSTNAYAEKEHRIDMDMSKCLNTTSNQTTAGMNQCVIDAMVDWDKELNRIYKLLMNELDEDIKEQLVLAQRQWIKQRDIEFKFLKSMYSMRKFRGSMYSNMHNMDALYVVKNRVLTLNKYLVKHKI